MKVTASKVDAFISQSIKNQKAVLVYGPDYGLVSERAVTIAKQIIDDLTDPFMVATLEEKVIKDDPALLADEAAALSFSGGRRLIQIKHPGDGVVDALTQTLENITPEHIQEHAFILVTAGELLPRSKLRQLFEKEADIAALPCYHDESRDISQVVKEYFSTQGFDAEAGVVEQIATSWQGDRALLRQALEKLSIYMGEARHITCQDVANCMGEVTESTLDDICFAVASGNQAILDKQLKKAEMQGILPVSILRAQMRYFLRLSNVSSSMAHGQPLDSALGALKPPVFFKHVPQFKQHVTRWSQKSNALTNALGALYAAELESKRGPIAPELVCQRTLMRLASLAK